MIIYNLFPLLAGRFTQWEPHLKRAATLGFDWVYLNPVQRLGASRSLYSIVDYFSFNPELVDPTLADPPEAQFRQAVETARRLGLKLMIDLVINHCAIDSPLTREHPEWFVHEPDGRIANASCEHNRRKVVWKDLAQFDHRHARDAEGLYRYCLQVVEHLLGLGIEGFRCDAAYQVPRAFWHRLIQEVKSRHPRVVFVAETLGCNADQTRNTARAGFDFVFNSSKYWNFHDWWLLEQYNLIRETAPSISFPESHDTPRLFAESHGNVNVLKQRYLFAALFATGVMMPIGFEFGFRQPLHVVHTTPADWETGGPDLCAYIAAVNAIKKNHPVFQEECPTSFLPCHNPNVLLMWKAATRHREESLLILNKDPWNYQDFYTDHFRHFLQSGAPLRDVSPEFPLDYIHEPFHYGLRPGQGIVLVTRRT
ncbi:MAG TPA: alpha-amylase family glycosyl hydrolase [Candidatus Paceibacterota bacterium]|nr:alpha-amylase family glycosyl hydrolase [Candidatus Paceibacterota bacterium]